MLGWVGLQKLCFALSWVMENGLMSMSALDRESHTLLLLPSHRKVLKEKAIFILLYQS